MKTIDSMQKIARFVLKASKMISTDETKKFLNMLVEAYNLRKKVLVVGAGRSGLVGKAFAMRLMHLGFNVYVLGETTTPSVTKNDLVIAISGSGSTEIIITVTKIAKRIGARVIAITSYKNSPLGQMSDHMIIIPGRTKVASEKDYLVRQILGLHEPLAPLGTLFENTAMSFLDGIISELMDLLNKDEEDLRKKHANVEMV